MSTKKSNRSTPSQAPSRTNTHATAPTVSTRKDLNQVIAEFFQIESADSTQALLWIITKAAMESGIADDWSAITRSNVLYLYERLHNLVADLDQVHTIHKYKALSEL